MAARHVQIPTECVKNENEKKLSNNAFALLVFLKAISFTERSNTISISHHRIKNAVGMSDNRTLKESLSCLYINGLIKEKIESLPYHSDLTITLTGECDKKPFVQVPIEIVYYLVDIGPIGLRLLFIYESYIKRSGDQKKEFAFPSFITIVKMIDISSATLSKYNMILEKFKLLSIKRHGVRFNGSYDENDRPGFEKWNNHYYPLLQNIKKRQFDTI